MECRNKKKVTIITLPLRNYNYGGILQNYALQQYLMQNFDVEVETVNVEYPKPELSFLLNLPSGATIILLAFGLFCCGYLFRQSRTIRNNN